MQPRRFFLDTSSRQFVSGLSTNFVATNSAFFEEDVEAVELYFLSPNQSGGAQAIDYSSNIVKLAVGITAPAVLQTNWSAASTTITASISSIQTGGNSANAIQRLSFSGRPPASGAFSLTLLATEIAGDTISGNRIFVSEFGQMFENRPVELDGFDERNGIFYMVNVSRGSFQIANSPGGEPLTIAGEMGDIVPLAVIIPSIVTLTADAIRIGIIAAGIVGDTGRPLIEVSGSYSTGFTLEFVDLLGTSTKANLGVSSTLAAAPALLANLSFNTNEVAALIAAGTTNNLRMEVEVSNGPLRQTYATTVSISDDLITSTSPIPAPVNQPVSSVNFDDGQGGTWAVSVDANGVLTATKQ